MGIPNRGLEQRFLSNLELLELVEKVTKDFDGQADELSEAIGMMVFGRLVGWRVVRLVCPRRSWRNASRIFGDPKDLLPEIGKYAYKSQALSILDKLGDYWDVIKGAKPSPPLEDRRRLQL